MPDPSSATLHPAPATPAGPRAWPAMLLLSLAGGLGWGIRGQYGHETGAMLAGLLVGLVAVALFWPQAPALSGARAAAWCAIAIGFGGSMTYGQTIGLTQNPPLIGNWAALRWGLLGLALKGGLWIGFAGAFLGMGLSRVRYRPRELLGVMAGLLALFFLGVWWWNTPFDPAQRMLPRLYFSADWRWEPDAALRPRPEVWGGMLLALLGLGAYLRAVRRDVLAWRLAGWAALGGALGFPAGQCLQAFHAWNGALFREGWIGRLDPYLNWWNAMEITFGLVFGAVLGCGLWRNRALLAQPDAPPETPFAARTEWLLAAVHVPLLVASEFAAWKLTDLYTEYGLLLGLLPVVAVAGGRWWPLLVVFPVTLLPIAGKTFAHLVSEEHLLAPVPGALLYLALPLLLSVAAMFGCARRAARGQRAGPFAASALLVTAWTFWALNFAFFRFAWPWQAWTIRTPSTVVLTSCALGLTAFAVNALLRKGKARMSPVGSR